MARPERGFKVPPEVPRYFADRGLKPAFSYLDVWAEEHASSFTVAKAVEVELLKLFHDSLKGAIDRGETFETWAKGLRPELEKAGWWGKRTVRDPDGIDKPRSVDFSAPRRLQTIFWGNMRSARAAGQWERIQRTKRALPYLLYVRTVSKEPRREHLGWAGIILPADHPFWRTHFPPNGWLCKCAVRQIGEAERVTKLRDADRYSSTAPTIETVRHINRRTGEITYVPVGIDPGWHTNPGIARARVIASGSTLSGAVRSAVETAAPQAIASAAAPLAPVLAMALRKAVERSIVADVQGAAFETFYGAGMARHQARHAAANAVKAAGGEKAAQDAARSAVGWTHQPHPIAIMPARVTTIVTDPVVTVSDAALFHSFDAHPVDLAGWRLLPDVLASGETHVSDDGDRLWFYQEIGGRWWVTVLTRKANAWRVMTHFDAPERYVERQRAKQGRRKIAERLETSGGGP